MYFGCWIVFQCSVDVNVFWLLDCIPVFSGVCSVC
jgi:hypothetical protein